MWRVSIYCINVKVYYTHLNTLYQQLWRKPHTFKYIMWHFCARRKQKYILLGFNRFLMSWKLTKINWIKKWIKLLLFTCTRKKKPTPLFVIKVMQSRKILTFSVDLVLYIIDVTIKGRPFCRHWYLAFVLKVLCRLIIRALNSRYDTYYQFSVECTSISCIRHFIQVLLQTFVNRYTY